MSVVAGLVPAISYPLLYTRLTEKPGTLAGEAAPFFERRWPGMTEGNQPVDNRDKPQSRRPATEAT